MHFLSEHYDAKSYPAEASMLWNILKLRLFRQLGKVSRNNNIFIQIYFIFGFL